MKPIIRRARKDEAATLTRLSFESKAYWPYPEEYFGIWKDELTITSEYIDRNEVYVFEEDGVLVGYYSVIMRRRDAEFSGVLIDKGHWLQHLFVAPEHIGRGFGAKLFDHVRARCRADGIRVLRVLADPNSRGFYEKMGCEYRQEVPSNIAGRTTPLLVLDTK